MKRLFYIILAIGLLTASCSQRIAETETIQKTDGFSILTEWLKENGEIINEKPEIPLLITSEELAKSNSENILSIDVRESKEYHEGHIPGAINIPHTKLLQFFETQIHPPAFTRIVLVCNTGQATSFYAMALRFLGYHNVSALKWGMSSWNKTYAEKDWLSKIGNSYNGKMVTEEYPKPQSGAFPVILTNKNSGLDIARERIEELLSIEAIDFIVEAKAVFENLNSYYIINYWPKDLYDEAHIPYAVQYQPNKSLTPDTDLATLPADKKILVYCYSGQRSAQVAAYLRLLGYDAYSLAFGANSYAHDFLLNKKLTGRFFSEEEIRDYEIESGNKSASTFKPELIDTKPIEIKGGC